MLGAFVHVEIRLEEVIAGEDLTPACVKALFPIAVTAGMANWLTLPMKGWTVPFSPVDFGLTIL